VIGIIEKKNNYQPKKTPNFLTFELGDAARFYRAAFNEENQN
jgi:hypothetical protein